MIFHNNLIWCSRNNNTSIHVFRIEEHRTVNITISSSLIQVIQTHKRTNFSSLCLQLTIHKMHGTHVIKNDFTVQNFIFGNSRQCFNCFRFTSTRITNEHKPFLWSIFHIQIDHGSMKRQPALFHHAEIVQSQTHLLCITKVMNHIIIRHLAYPDIMCDIMIESCVFLPVWIAKQHNAVWLMSNTFTFSCQLKQIA